MMRLLRSIAIGSAVVLATTAVRLLAPTAVQANAAEPEKLWAGFSSPAVWPSLRMATFMSRNGAQAASPGSRRMAVAPFLRTGFPVHRDWRSALMTRSMSRPISVTKFTASRRTACM